MINISLFILGLFVIILDSSLIAGPWLLLIYYASLLLAFDSEDSIGWVVVSILGDILAGRLMGVSLVFLVLFFGVFKWTDEHFFGQKIPQWLVFMCFSCVWIWLFGGGVLKIVLVGVISWFIGVLLKKEKYVALR